MAKRAKKKATRTKVSAVSGPTKELKIASADAKYFGTEPNFLESQPDSDHRQLDLSKSFTWYSQLFGNKEAKEFIMSYLELNGDKKTAKLVKKVPDSQVRSTYGWLARLTLRGLILEQEEKDRLGSEIDRLLSFVSQEKSSSEDEKESPNKPNIQEIMLERASEAAGEFEGMFDDYIDAGCPKDFNTKDFVLTALQERKILPQHVNNIIKGWEKVKGEFVEVQQDKCEQLRESYKFMSKTQIKNAIKYVESIISDLHGYVSIKQSAKKPRARKAVPVEKVVAKLKYCSAYKQDGLDLVSVSPTKLHGCSEAWVYDTKKRKMHHYVADEYSKVLTVKGTTLLGFDKVESGMKTLRKPQEQIKEMTGSKPAARKYFKNINAVQAIPTGRFNENMIILKAF